MSLANLDLANFDLALCGATVALLLVLAATLLRDFRNSVAGRLAAALALGSAAHALTYAIDIRSPISVWHAPLIALSTGNVVVFWLFTRALFDDAFVLRWRHALIWAAVAIVSFINCMWIAPAGHLRISIIAINLLSLCFIALAVGQTVSSWSADLIERRRSLRVFIVSAVVLAVIVAAISYAMTGIAAADLFAAAPEAMAAIGPSRESAVIAESNAGDQRLVEALMRLMADERIYRHDNISIGTLATRLAIPEYKLRRLINQRLGYRNFNVFLNNHRIEEAKAALADPTQVQVPVITIAMDAGFQSLGPFNRAFKATTGVTPSEYRRLKVPAA